MFKITCTFEWIEVDRVYRLTYRKFLFGINYSTWEDCWDVFDGKKNQKE